MIPRERFILHDNTKNSFLAPLAYVFNVYIKGQSVKCKLFLKLDLA